MNEQQFLEMSDDAFNELIAREVFGLETYAFNGGFLYRDRSGSTTDYWFPTKIPDYKNTWQGMGKGIEHANENGWYVEAQMYEDGSANMEVSRTDVLDKLEAYYSDTDTEGVENGFIAFFCAYLKALGVLE